MKDAPPAVELLVNLCPLCVLILPVVTIFVMIKLMKKPEPAQVVNPDPEEVEPT